MRTPRRALIVFLRYPEAGSVKSRLAQGIGWGEAARVYEKLVRRGLGVAADLKLACPDIRIYVCFTPESRRREVEASFSGPWELIPQEGAHLGDRMARAMDRAMALGNEQVVLVGTDLADIQPSDVMDGFEALESGYAALGPAADGGFYLIGLSRPCPAALDPEAWGGDAIFERTERLLRADGLRVRKLAQRRDIDRPEDLGILVEQPLFHDRLSVVIPTLSPIEGLRRPLLEALEAGLWPDDEIVVVCGTDETVSESLQPLQLTPRIRYASCPRGRGLQLNFGAGLAEGNLLLFLHDDSIPPAQFGYIVRKISTLPGTSLGCFHLAFEPSTPLLDWIAAWANARTRRFKLPYGDQGFFCRREVFQKAGGFRRQYLMEDVDFADCCRKLGDLMVRPEKVLTSPGRYLRKGPLRASLQNHSIMLMYRLGVDERRLYSLYYRRSLSKNNLPTSGSPLGH